jgi:hypothetical protein
VATERLLNRHHSRRVGEGVAAGGSEYPRGGNGRERATVGRSGAGSIGDLERLLRRGCDDVGDGSSGASGRGRISACRRGWETEKLEI